MRGFFRETSPAPFAAAFAASVVAPLELVGTGSGKVLNIIMTMSITREIDRLRTRCIMTMHESPVRVSTLRAAGLRPRQLAGSSQRRNMFAYRVIE